MVLNMYEEKALFIQNQLQALVKQIDEDIDNLEIIPTSNGKDIEIVRVNYKTGWDIQVNVECDSLLAITKDVINKI
jgi:hypothetical protein